MGNYRIHSRVWEGLEMGDLIWLSDAQMRRIRPYLPLPHGFLRVDDRWVISGISFVLRRAPSSLAREICNRFSRQIGSNLSS